MFFSRWKYRLSMNLNILKTVYINFTFLPFRQAIRFPVFIYGKLKIHRHSGKIIIEDRIKMGMIHWGLNTDKFSASKGGAFIDITGKLIFKGAAFISSDYVLSIYGECTIGKFTTLGYNAKICCWNNISIGKSCRITFETQIFDTNFHYIRNIETGRVDRRDGTVVIGNYCWIGNRTTITKGALIPDYTMIASLSLVNKDFISSNVKYPFIAGAPAKIIGSGRVRIFSPFEEEKIDDFFKNNPDALYYKAETGEKDEEEEVENYFSAF